LRYTWLLLTVLLPLAPWSGAALAQQRLLAVTDTEVVEFDPRPAARGTVLRRFPASPAPPSSGPVAVLGGKYLVWISAWPNEAIVLFHTRSGAVRRVTLPNFSEPRVLGTDGNARLVALGGSHPSNIALIGDVRTGQVQFLDLGANTDRDRITYAPGAHRLFVARRRAAAFNTFHDIDVIDAATGALVKTIDVSPLTADLLRVNSAGTRVYVTNALVGTFVVDVASGAQVASSSAPPLQGTLFTPVAEEGRNRLLSSIWLPDDGSPEFVAWKGISAFAADTLQFLGRASVPEPPLPAPTPSKVYGLRQTIDATGVSATLFVLQATTVAGKNTPGVCTGSSRLLALHADTGAVRQIVDTTAALGASACVAAMVRLTEPYPPAPPTADVIGHQVTVRWPATPGATHYEVEAGSGAGLANLAVIRVIDPHLVADAVPSGVYYLRVRALNSIGTSRPSGQLRVVVP
jgi:hypothetical protein